MGTTMRPWTRRILELIDAGVTDREEIIRQAVPFVPQGHAYRVRELTNERQRGSQGATRPSDRTALEIHRIGARRVIGRTLISQIAHGYLVRDGDQIRRNESRPSRPERNPS